jgi:hypothetical protein
VPTSPPGISRGVVGNAEQDPLFPGDFTEVASGSEGFSEFNVWTPDTGEHDNAKEHEQPWMTSVQQGLSSSFIHMALR